MASLPTIRIGFVPGMILALARTGRYGESNYLRAPCCVQKK